MSDDERLLAGLGAAVRAAREVPPEFLAAARAAYAWRNIDAELAALTYDSAVGDREPVTTRAHPAGPRALTFAAAGLVIELEVGPDGCRGQLVPARPGRIEVQAATGEVIPVEADDVGYFAVRPVPPGRFRLRWRPDTGTEVVTSWVVV
jgi:hypothetical protein